MITDRVEYIDKYQNISKEVSDFLKNLTAETPTGHYEINETAYANIDEYETKPVKNCKFEAHKKYIDIQMLLKGSEELDYMPVKDLDISEEYNTNRDVMFFENSDKLPDTLQLEPFKFALIYPHEAHRPQMNIKNIPQKVKKVVVKILA